MLRHSWLVVATLAWISLSSSALGQETTEPGDAASLDALMVDGTSDALVDAPDNAGSVGDSTPIVWHTDYLAANRQAKDEGKLLFVFFHASDTDENRRRFESESLTPAILEPHRDRYVWARLPLDSRCLFAGQDMRVLDHPAFREMGGKQGVAIVDFKNRSASHYTRVVSAFPLSTIRNCPPEYLSVILNLPDGTLTQRTMVFAVRIHPEAPKSALGQISPVLITEAQRHSHHQAQIKLQGHHEWETRFHRINARLPSDLIAQEVVAESWPNEHLVEAAIECVHSWRRSEGHWSAVRRRHPLFGFDMKRGRNGIWYATGIFGMRRH
jgi:hypothetical protein